jgi:hypothetical protein
MPRLMTRKHTVGAGLGVVWEKDGLNRRVSPLNPSPDQLSKPP